MILSKIKNMLNRKTNINDKNSEKKEEKLDFSAFHLYQRQEHLKKWNEDTRSSLKKNIEDFKVRKSNGEYSQDSYPNLLKINPYGNSQPGGNPLIIDWFNSQGFIGWQNCAIIAQHWLVNRCCTLPALDAIKNGYSLTNNSGEDLDPKISQKILDLDRKYNINHHLVDFFKKSAIFGIRIALFKVRSNDKKYYEKPFNIDGITPHSYEGIVQIDPYWCAPELDMESAGDPASMSFYEPTWWNINGKLYHKTHLIITKYADVADVLSPTYIFGGIPLTQMLYEPVYNYERTLTEAPILVQSKRLYVGYIDFKNALANPKSWEERISILANFKNNYGFYFLDRDDRVEKFDTSLTDLSLVIQDQRQEIASISRIVDTVLFSKQISGLNNKGDGDFRNYADTVIDVQKRMQDLLDRHHQILIKSEIDPIMKNQDGIIPVWNDIATEDVDKKSESNWKDAQRDNIYVDLGVISPEEVRSRLAKTTDSGYELNIEISSNESESEKERYSQYSEEEEEDSIEDD